jgi:hypothetical protein
MWRVKQQLLRDSAALLRLQDRFPAAAAGGTQRASGVSAAASAAAARGTAQGAAAGLNPLLLQAASDRAFAARPLVAQLVAHTHAQLAAAAAAAPSRQHVAAAVQRRLQQPHGQQQQAVPPLLQAHAHHIVQAECEAASGGGWQCLLGHLPTRQQTAAHGWQLCVSDADEALRLWWQHVRAGRA